MRFGNVWRSIFATVVYASVPASAQPYPNKPIRIIVAIAAGSPTDVILRSAGQRLLGTLGQSLIVENRPGGNQVIGADACARANPDGYTYCVVSNTAISVNPHIVSKLPYDPDRDFKPVTALWYLINGLVATASLQVNSVKDLQALAVAKPGWLNFGTQGAGTGPDIFRQWLNERWKTSIVGVPYGGANLIMNALLAGDIHFTRIAPLGAAVGGQIAAGKVKLLAVGTAVRHPQFPDAPTYDEAGIGGFPERTWWGLFSPAGTPDAMVRRINSEFVRLFREPKFAAYLETQFVEPAVSAPEEFAGFLKVDREQAAAMVRKYNIPRQ